MERNLKNSLIVILLFAICGIMQAQNFGGKVTDSKSNPLQNVKVLVYEDNKTVYSDSNGDWSIPVSDSNSKTIVFHLDDYAYEQINTPPSTSINIILRNAQLSTASQREILYKSDGCTSVNKPDNPEWNIEFEIKELKGDLAPDQNHTRRDPSAVIKVNGLYYIWYSYSSTFNTNKLAPWDLNDIYYATSADGWDWTEQGLAVGRGEAGSFDHRSVFTTEIFENEGKYYLVYQAAADEDGIYNRNVVGMATADSPNGPWTKLEFPVLYPTYTNDLYFDNNAVHDPCIISYNNKYYLYYKGECNCMDNGNCSRWCNPICGYNKQVKWGVAISDTPTGPYVKSEYNPITNTGHEVMVWPYQEGVAILQHQDGPEGNTIQFSEDGLNFEMKGQVTNIPEAAGLFRAPKSDINPHAGITWGVGHQLKWNAGPKGWMYIYRFDKVSNDPSGLNIIPEKIQLGENQNRNIGIKLNPFNADKSKLTWRVEDNSIATVNESGTITGKKAGTTKVYAEIESLQLQDFCEITVQQEGFDAQIINIEANSFTNTGGTYDDSGSGGPGYGMNNTNSGVNYVNKNDYATYDVSIPTTGIYQLSYNISTPSSEPVVSLELNNELVASDEVYTNGGWDAYYSLLSDHLIEVNNAGTNEFKLIASGNDTWQWNMQNFQLEKLCNLNINTIVKGNSLSSKIKTAYNANTNCLIISGLENEYEVKIYSLLGKTMHSCNNSGTTEIYLNNKMKGVHIVNVTQNNLTYSFKIAL